MGDTLTLASNQWATRPPDERFESLAALKEDALLSRTESKEQEIHLNKIRAVSEDNSLYFLINDEWKLEPNHYSFRQLCRIINYPAAALQEGVLPADLAAKVLNHRLKLTSKDAIANVLFRQSGERSTLRCITGTTYSRLWDSDVVTWMEPLLARGWKVPPARPAFADQPGTRPATEADVIQMGSGGGIRIEVGDPIAPAGLYRSDRDMFIFMIHDTKRIEDGTEQGLRRGFFGMNSEVCASSFKFIGFNARGCCGNHLLWDVYDVKKLIYRHVGEVQKRAFAAIQDELMTYAEEETSPIEKTIKWLQTHNIAPSKELVVETVQKFNIPNLGKKRIEEGYQMCEAHIQEDGSPRSWWGLAQGITRLSQLQFNMDRRIEIDTAAGKLLDIGVGMM